MPSKLNPRPPEMPSKPPTTGVTSRGECRLPKMTKKVRRRGGMARDQAVMGREGQPVVPYTPAGVLVPQRSVQQEDRALG